MLTLVLSLSGLLVASVAFGAGGTWGYAIGALATLVSAWSSIRQYLESKPFQMEFDATHWRKVGDFDFRAPIAAATHKKGRNPIVSMLVKQENGEFVAVVSSPTITSAGDVELEGGKPCTGRVIIK